MKRRGFLAAVIGVAAVGGAKAAESRPWPDSFERNGWRVKWLDYQRAVNQRVWVGGWFADRIGDDGTGEFWYCTTMGQCDKAHRYSVLDLSDTREWPTIDGTHTERQMELNKRAALARLLEHLS